MSDTNVDYRSRCPLPSTTDAPLLDRIKGEVLAPATFLAFMVEATTPTEPAMEERDI